MFIAVITCAVTVSCGLTGEFRSSREHVSRPVCMEQTTAAIQLMGEDPAKFKIHCKVKG